MIKGGGTEAEAKTLADEFQDAAGRGDVRSASEIKEENDIIRAKALPGTKKKEPANLPNEFVTNDDFCPGCGLELKSLPIERNNLWTDMFRAISQDRPIRPRRRTTSSRGCSCSAGWGSSGGSAPIAVATSTTCATTSRR